jgi:hypothetical protein
MISLSHQSTSAFSIFFSGYFLLDHARQYSGGPNWYCNAQKSEFRHGIVNNLKNQQQMTVWQLFEGLPCRSTYFRHAGTVRKEQGNSAIGNKGAKLASHLAPALPTAYQESQIVPTAKE